MSGEVKDAQGYILQTVVYLFAPHNGSPQKVFYLLKAKEDEPTIGKLIGWGGGFEPIDTLNSHDCAIRELKEELKEEIKEQLSRIKLTEQGILLVENISEKRKIHIFKATLEKRISEGYKGNEGWGIYKPIDYHQTHPDEFMKSDLKFLDTLYFSDNKFETRVHPNGTITHRIFK